MSELRSPEPTQDVKRWRLTMEGEGFTFSVEIPISGRERLMNNTPERLTDLLATRFHRAATTIREEWLMREVPL